MLKLSDKYHVGNTVKIRESANKCKAKDDTFSKSLGVSANSADDSRLKWRKLKIIEKIFNWESLFFWKWPICVI